MVGRGQVNEAFTVALKAEDEMLAVRLVARVGSFEFEKLYEDQREELMRKALNMLEQREFSDIFIPCIGEAVDKFMILMPKNMRENIYNRLGALQNETEFSENQRNEIKRICSKVAF